MLLKPGLFKKENFDFAETCTHTHTHTHTQYTIVRHLFSVQYFSLGFTHIGIIFIARFTFDHWHFLGKLARFTLTNYLTFNLEGRSFQSHSIPERLLGASEGSGQIKWGLPASLSPPSEPMLDWRPCWRRSPWSCSRYPDAF